MKNAQRRAAVIAQLPPSYATALELRSRGASIDVIAQLLDVDPSGVPTLLLLADAKLQSLLDAMTEGISPVEDREGRGAD